MKAKTIFFFPFLIFPSFFIFSQTFIDPAQSYNMMDIQNNSGKYYVVGNYKVKGSPFLFGGGQKGSLYAKNEYGGDIAISYNSYLQEVEFDVNSKERVIKELINVDSFILKSDGDIIKEDLKFINAAHIPSDEKCFFQKVSEGQKFNLYKKYSSRLEIVSTNIVQSELRQFALKTDYFYLDKTKKIIKKLKIGKSSLVKQFKELRDLSFYVDDSNLNGDTENVLKEIFRILNE